MGSRVKHGYLARDFEDIGESCPCVESEGFKQCEQGSGQSLQKDAILNAQPCDRYGAQPRQPCGEMGQGCIEEW